MREPIGSRAYSGKRPEGQEPLPLPSRTAKYGVARVVPKPGARAVEKARRRRLARLTGDESALLKIPG
jgi:hypothetical protein